MALPANANTVRVRGYRWNQAGTGSTLGVTFAPVLLKITDDAAFGFIDLTAKTVKPDLTTGYFECDLIATNDPDLTNFAYRVTLEGFANESWLVEVDHNSPLITLGSTQVRAAWLTELATLVTPPGNLTSYLNAAQTQNAIVNGILAHDEDPEAHPDIRALIGTGGGGGATDLSDYYTKEQVDDEVSGKADTSALATVATSGSYNDLSDKPSAPDLSGYAETSSLATVATSGAYGDLSGAPTIPDSPDDIGAQPAGSYATTDALTSGLAGKADTSSLSAVATSGAYTDLSGKPSIPTTFSQLAGTVPQAAVPAVALTEFLGTVADETAMLALTGQRGDWCTRTDLGTDWQLVADDSTQLASWREHVYPASPVQSVNGRSGAVTGLAEASSMNTADEALSGRLDTLEARPAIDSPDDIGAQPAGDYATSGDLADGLAGKADTSSLAAVATSGSYNDLSDKPASMSGDTGPQGPPGLVWRGTWDSNVSYAVDDAVAYSGSSYVASLASTGVIPGADDDTWALLASKGDTGPQGETGDTGADGAPGTSGLSPITVGEETFPRFFADDNSATGGASGTMLVGYFTATKNETITKVTTAVGAAGASLTLARYGIYSVGSDGALIALLAATANDTSLWTVAYQPTNGYAVTETLSASWNKVAGTRYAVGLLAVGTTVPQFMGARPMATDAASCAVDPRLCARVSDLSDLPSSVAAGSLINYGQPPYVAFLP